MINYLLIFILLTSSGIFCQSQPDSLLQVEINRHGFRASVQGVYGDPNKLELSLANNNLSSQTSEIDFRLSKYGRFLVFAPQLKPMALSFGSDQYSIGQIKIPRKNQTLIFFIGNTKEEFSLIVDNNQIEIKPISSNGYIKFHERRVLLYPDSLLSISVYHKKRISENLVMSLSDLECERIKLHLGDYQANGQNKIKSYDTKDEFAHTIKNQSEFIYFLKVKKNYSAIDSLLKKHQFSNDKKIRNYNYSYNFNFNFRRDREKGKPIYAKLDYSGTPYNNFKKEINISFVSNKKQLAIILITNKDGEIVKTINKRVGKGEYKYKWNKLDDNNQKLPAGIYHYKVVLEDLTITKKMMLLD